MEEIINKIFKEKYPKGLSAEYTKEEMVGYMMAINDIKEQLHIHDDIGSFWYDDAIIRLK
jgi:hypothetical protein